jgi:hypothetical protein
MIVAYTIGTRDEQMNKLIGNKLLGCLVVFEEEQQKLK